MPRLGIEMHPLGRVEPMDALNPAEMALLRTLKEHAVWCLDAMAAIGGAEDGEAAREINFQGYEK